VADNEYVIASDKAGEHIRNLHHPWRRLSKRAGLEHARIHDLRHTYASNAVMQGINIVMVGKLLGHSQVQTTMRYAHLADDPVREAANLVARALHKTLKSKPSRRALPTANGTVVNFPGGPRDRGKARVAQELTRLS
jgi:hypothetical protein